MKLNSNYLTDQALAKFVENLRKTRSYRNLSLEKLSNMASYNREDLSLLECGKKKNIGLQPLLRISRALDVSFPDVLSNTFLSYFSENEEIEIPRFKDDDYLGVFVDNCRNLISRRNQTCCSFASDDETMNVTGSTISQIINGRRNNPRIITLQKIANNLEKDLYDLFIRNVNY